jgi:hypothetical protein
MTAATRDADEADGETAARTGVGGPLAWARSRDGRLELLALAIVAAVLIVPSVGLMRYQGPPMEEGFMLAFPEQILRGRLPHRDFLHLYGPGSLWVLAGVYWVFEPSLYVERLVGLLQHAGVAFGLYALLRPFGRRLATGSAVISVLLLIGPGGLSAMAWNGALALGICSLAVGVAAGARPASRSTTALLALSGALGGAALLYRPDMIVAVALGLGAVVVGLAPDRRIPVAAGLAGTLLLYVPHVLLSGIEESVRGMFVEPVFELRGGRTLPVPPSWGEIDGFLQRAGALRRTGWPFPMPELSQQIHLWFWLVPISIVVTLLAARRLRRREPGSARARALWPAALFGAALLPQALQRPDTTHLAWVTGITFAVMLPSITSLLEGRRPAMRPNARLLTAYGVIAVILVAVIPFYPARTYVDLVGQSFGRNRFGEPIRNDGRVFYFGDAQGAAEAQQVVDRLAEESEPGERLIAGPTDLSRTNYNDAFFYHLFPDLVPGTRYIEMDPGIANAEGSGLADELRANDWLILSDSASLWNEPNESAEAGSTEPNDVVRDLYCPVVDAGGFSLLQRCRDEP